MKRRRSDSDPLLALVAKPPEPATVTATGIVNVVEPVLVTLQVPLMLGVELWPEIVTTSPVLNPWDEDVVTVVVEVAEEEVTESWLVEPP